jgi:hypothetical protein
MPLRWAQWHDIYIPSFMKIDTVVKVILRFCIRNLRGLNVGYYWWEGFMKCAVEMDSAGMIYVPSSMMIGSGI